MASGGLGVEDSTAEQEAAAASTAAAAAAAAEAAADEEALALMYGLGPSRTSKHSNRGSRDNAGADSKGGKSGGSAKSRPTAATFALLDTGAAMTSAEAQRRPAETGRPPTRVEQLAMPQGMRVEGSQLAVEYCMPVDRSNAEDGNKWRAIGTRDVTHLIAVSSADLFITFW